MSRLIFQSQIETPTSPSCSFFPRKQTLCFFTILTPSEQSKLSLEDMKAQKTELERILEVSASEERSFG